MSVKQVLGLLCSCIVAGAWATPPDAVIDQVDALMNPPAKSAMRLVFEKNGRVDEAYEMTTYTRDNNQKVIVRFTAPATSIGNDLIMLDRNVWMYQQSAGRTVRVPANLAFGGTGFSYGDIVRLNLKDNYDATLVSENDQQWVLRLTAKDRKASYYRIDLTVAKDGFKPVTAVAGSPTGATIKTIQYGKVRTVNGRQKPTELSVTSPLAPGEVSTMTYVNETPMVLPERYFNSQNLGLRLEDRQ